ncbi:MAG: TonB-dependent receptor [Pseudomonadota bacterium]
MAEPSSVDDIVVTAERRASAALTAPLSVSRIDGAVLDRLGADHPSEILARAPGVFVHRGSGQEHLTAIRSPVLTGGAGAGSFLFLQDGVPLRAAGFANVNGLFEAHSEIADAVEVVRGPSGAVYGANAIHGVIDVRTPTPGAAFSDASDATGARLTMSGDTIGRIKGAGEIGWRRIEGLGGLGAGFAALSVLDDPGFRADSGVDQQKLTVRQTHSVAGADATTSLYVTNLNQETAGFVEGEAAYLDAVLRRSNPNPEAFRDARAVRLASEINASLSDSLSLSVTPYFRLTDMDFLLHFLPSKALEENRHWSVGAQSAVYYDAPGVSLYGGLDLERTSGVLTEFQSIPDVFSFTQGLHYDYKVNALGASPFAGASVSIAEGLTLASAVRVDYTRYAYDNLTDSGVVGRFLRPDDRKDDFLTVSPKASVTYSTGAIAAYIAYARGARPPQTTDLYRLQINQTTDPAEPETISSIEGGLRGRIGAAAFHLVGYAMEKKNFFFRDADGFNVSDGKTRHVGGEADLDIDISPSLRLSADVAYGRHTYRFERPVLNLARSSETIAFGNAVDTSPKWLAGARALWAPVDAPVSAEVSWRHVSRYFMDAGNSVVYPGHDVVDVRGAWRFANAAEAFLTLRNVANTFYAERADFAFGDERYFPGEGRVLTLGFRLTR